MKDKLVTWMQDLGLDTTGAELIESVNGWKKFTIYIRESNEPRIQEPKD
jgi:hypothetical protein